MGTVTHKNISLGYGARLYFDHTLVHTCTLLGYSIVVVLSEEPKSFTLSPLFVFVGVVFCGTDLQGRLDGVAATIGGGASQGEPLPLPEVLLGPRSGLQLPRQGTVQCW